MATDRTSNQETNRDKVLRREVVKIADSRLSEMQAQAISGEGVSENEYHWHWAAIVNELIARRADETTSLTEAEELLKAWTDPLPPNGRLYWAHVEKAREYFRKRLAVEPARRIPPREFDIESHTGLYTEPKCQHDLLKPDTTIEVIDPWKAKCKVCVEFFDLPGRPEKAEEPAEELYAPVLLCRTCGARKDAGEHFKNCAEIRSALKASENQK